MASSPHVHVANSEEEQLHDATYECVECYNDTMVLATFKGTLPCDDCACYKVVLAFCGNCRAAVCVSCLGNGRVSSKTYDSMTTRLRQFDQPSQAVTTRQFDQPSQAVTTVISLNDLVPMHDWVDVEDSFQEPNPQYFMRSLPHPSAILCSRPAGHCPRCLWPRAMVVLKEPMQCLACKGFDLDSTRPMVMCDICRHVVCGTCYLIFPAAPTSPSTNVIISIDPEGLPNLTDAPNGSIDFEVVD